MESSSSLKLELKWEPKKSEDEVGTLELTKLLNNKDRLTESEKQKLSEHFLYKIKKLMNNNENSVDNSNYSNVIQTILDYRKWYEFRLFYIKKNDKKKEKVSGYQEVLIEDYINSILKEINKC